MLIGALHSPTLLHLYPASTTYSLNTLQKSHFSDAIVLFAAAV